MYTLFIPSITKSDKAMTMYMCSVWNRDGQVIQQRFFQDIINAVRWMENRMHTGKIREIKIP